MKKIQIALLVMLSMFTIFGMTALADYSEGDLYYTIKNGSITITGYFGRDTELYVPSRIGNYPVNSIGDEAFVGTTLVKVYLPTTVTTISPSAFDEGVEVVKDYDKATVYVASIGTTKYETLQAAFSAVPTNGVETTIKFLKSFTVESSTGFTIEANQNVTINMNGYVLTWKDTSTATTSRFIFKNNGRLTIKSQNSSDGIAYQRTTGSTSFHGFIDNHGIVNIDGGNFTTSASGNVCFIQCSNDLRDTVTEISDGDYKVLYGAGIFRVLSDAGIYRNTLNIYDGNFLDANSSSQGIFYFGPQGATQTSKVSTQIYDGTFSSSKTLFAFDDISQNVFVRVSNGRMNGEVVVSANSTLSLPVLLIEDGEFDLTVNDYRGEQSVLPVQICGGVYTDNGVVDSYHMGNVECTLSDLDNKDVYPWKVLNNSPVGYWNNLNLSIQSDLQMKVYASITGDTSGIYAIIHLPDGKTKTITEPTVTGYGICFSFAVNPQYMTYGYQIDLMCPEGFLDTMISYSVRDYCDTMAGLTTNEKLLKLLSAMLNYGAAAQVYTNTSLDDLANNLSWVSEHTTEFTEVTSHLNIQGDDDTAYFQYVNLDLADVNYIVFQGVSDQSNIELQLYRKQGTNAPVLVKSQKVTGTSFVLKSDEIRFYEFSDVYEAVLLRDGEELIRVTYDVQSYVYQLQNSSNTIYKNLVRTMWNYGQCAAAYK